MRKLKYIANRALFRLSPVLAERVGIDFRLDTPSRVFLETRVFAYLNRLAALQREPQQLLFLGLDKHNWHYPRLLRATFHSLDISPRNAVYGRPGLHRIGDALDMAEHYGADAFDVVVANGLLGFGIDGEAGLRRLLAQCHAVLRLAACWCWATTICRSARRFRSKWARNSKSSCPPSMGSSLRATWSTIPIGTFTAFAARVAEARTGAGCRRGV
ncbi:class I SAM-dependent methyltransferase [Achromobacter xylosoxidans]